MSGWIRNGYILELTDEDRKYAADELGEDAEQTSSHIATLRDSVKQMTHLSTPDSDEFLLMFLRQGKFSQKRAREVLDNFTKNRVTDPYSKIYITKPELSPAVEKMFEQGVVAVLPGVSDTCPRVMYVRPGLFDPSSVNVFEVMSACIISLEIALLDPVTQIYGLQTIEDYRGVTLRHSTMVSLSAMKVSMSAFINSMPIRYRMFHLYKAPGFINAMISLFKSFLSAKLASRLFGHGDDASIHAKIDRRVLPDELGGEAGPSDELAARWYEHVKKNLGYFQCFSDVKYNASKKVQVEGTFRKLNND